MSKCPHCSGILCPDYDGNEKYLTCLGCAREFNLNMTPRTMTPTEFYSCYGIKLTVARKCAKMRLE